MLTLCMLALHHARPVLTSSSCSMLSPSLLGVDCLFSSLLRGPGPPTPPSPELNPFPSGPRQRPTLVGHTSNHSFSLNSEFGFHLFWKLHIFLTTICLLSRWSSFLNANISRTNPLQFLQFFQECCVCSISASVWPVRVRQEPLLSFSEYVWPTWSRTTLPPILHLRLVGVDAHGLNLSVLNKAYMKCSSSLF
jgi:hypothetical protein